MRERMAQRLQDRKAEEARPLDLQAIAPGARKLEVRYGASAKQAIDVYVPPGAQGAPVLVMVHGGAWKIGDKANSGSIENKLKHWLPKGYVFVSVNYRLLPEAMAEGQAQDVAAAMRLVQARAGEWGGDPKRIVLMGHSAGAHLAALLSARPDMVGRPWAGTVVLDSAAMKVSTVMERRHPAFYDEAFGADPAGWARVSPMDQWTRSAMPMLLVCSSQRPDKPCDEARAFADLTARSGVTTPVLPQALSHADINRTLGLPGAYTQAVDAFIGDVLK
ncbi:alpha/beta hydrolase [Caulobacter sp. 602-2]|uniref:Alpha/beta hydrolase n=2 Tax=Caulobacter sp. 602-2 TaxID=2710887 RepID=A0A6G4QWA9_9CAUL|nr:alpha/beta hydrolase [Caulobacter sp. 602-2]